MAVVLSSLLAKGVSVEAVIKWLKSEDHQNQLLDLLQCNESHPGDFISFFLNFLRDQSSAFLHESSASSVTTPSKTAISGTKPSTGHTSVNLVDSVSHESTPLPTELFKTPESAGQLINRTQNLKSVSSGPGKKHSGYLASSDCNSSFQDVGTNDVKYQAFQARVDCGNSTPRVRYHRTNLLSDFITPKATGDSSGQIVFSEGKKSRGKAKVSANRQDSSRKVNVNTFSLESDMDFPEMDANAVSRATKVALPPRRIMPTLISSSDGKSDSSSFVPLPESPADNKNTRRIPLVPVSSTDKNSAFTRVPIVPAPALAMPRSVWAQPRNFETHSVVQTVREKTPSKSAVNEANNNDSQSVSQKSPRIGLLEVRKLSTTPQKTSLSRLLSCETVSANPAVATCVDELEILAQFYSCCIAESLVPNVVVEMYFITQLLCVRSSPSLDSFKGVHEDNSNYFSSVHNCVLFASQVLVHLQRLFLLLDRHTRYLLANNQRVCEFVPELREVLSLSVVSSVQAVPVCTPTLMGGVTFQADTDNRTNFPSEKSFQLFKKQRDIFYELLREWEDKHMCPGWTVKNCQTDKIRGLVHYAGSDLSNHLHLVRLFILQLIQMCRIDGSKLMSDQSDDIEQSELKNLKPERLKRLQERLIMPSSVGSVCPNPSFPGCQEFFRDFIVCASSFVFNRHICDGLVAKIVELSTSSKCSVPDPECEEDGSVSNDMRSELAHCLVTLRVLGKFLGFVTFLPYQSTESPVESVALLSIQARNETSPSFDVCHQLTTSIRQHRLSICLAWLIDFLSMIDSLSTRLSYYQNMLGVLIFIYRYCCRLLSKQHSHAVLMIVCLLGWFFELGLFPEVVHLTECEMKATDSAQLELHLENIDPNGLVDQRVLYSCCPHLGEIRSVLLDFEVGGRNQRGAIRKITPVLALTAPPPVSQAAALSTKHIEISLEESFFRLHSSSLRRSVEFVAERLASNWIKIFQAETLAMLLESGRNRCKKLALDVQPSKNASVDNIRLQLEEFASNTSRKVSESCKSEYSSYFQLKSVDIMSSLLSTDMSRKVVYTASHIACRMASDKVSTWLATNMSPGFFNKQMKTEFERQVRIRSTQHSAGNISEDTHEPASDQLVIKRHDSDLLSPSDLIIKLKDVVKLLLVRHGKVDKEKIKDTLSLVPHLLTSRQDLLPAGIGAIARLMADVTLITIARRPALWTPCLQSLVVELWLSNPGLKMPIKKIVCCRTVSYLDSSPDPESSWLKFTSLLDALICCCVLSSNDIELGIFNLTNNNDYIKLESRVQFMQHLRNLVGEYCKQSMQCNLTDDPSSLRCIVSDNPTVIAGNVSDNPSTMPCQIIDINSSYDPLVEKNGCDIRRITLHNVVDDESATPQLVSGGHVVDTSRTGVLYTK